MDSRTDETSLTNPTETRPWRDRIGHAKSQLAHRMHNLKLPSWACFTVYPNENPMPDSGTPDPDPIVPLDQSPQFLSGRFQYFSTGFTVIGYTFVLQVVLHALTFGLNGLAFRRLDSASLGLVNLRLGLFYSTLMFVSREAFRRACLSRGGELTVHCLTTSPNPTRATVDAPDEDGNEQESQTLTPGTNPRDLGTDGKALAKRRVVEWIGLVNLIWLVVPIGFIVSLILGYIWINVLPSPDNLDQDTKTPNQSDIHRRYVVCLFVYTLSALFELTTEPFWLMCQLSHMVRARIFIEAFANTMRALGIVVAILTVDPSYAIYSLALPQILHGSTLLVSYLVYFRNWIPKLNPEQVWKLDYICGIQCFGDLFPKYRQYPIDRSGLELVYNFFGQCLMKQLLTEGERYLISAFHLISFADQGIYDLVNNLGSLAARLLFLPLEESCHFIFGQCLQRNVPPNEQKKSLLVDVFRMFRTTLRLSSLVAWIGVTFAQSNSLLLLTLYGGENLASKLTAVYLLQLYSAYVLLLAWNGSTEALLMAAMSPSEVLQHNQRLLMFSFIFLGASWFLVPRLGVYGFVLANGINMLVRILYSSTYINRFVQRIHEPVNQLVRSNDEDKTEDELEQDARERLFVNHPDLPDSSFSLPRLMLPSFKQMIVLSVSLTIGLISKHWFCCTHSLIWTMLHIVINAILLFTVLAIMYLEETDLVYLVRSGLLKKKNKTE